MSAKAALLTAIRDELRSAITGVENRVYVVVQDAQGNQLLPKEAACPFLTVADAGMVGSGRPGQVQRNTYRVRVRAHVQDLTDCETPVLGNAATGATGAAEFQGLIAAALDNALLASRITGLEAAVEEAEPMVDVIADESWWAMIGDVLMRYEMTEAVG